MKTSSLLSWATKLILAWALAAPAFAQVTARSYIAITEDGRVLLEHNADDIRPLASISKLVALGELKLADQQVLITQDERDTLKGTRMRLKVGAYLQSELLEAALISSNNEAAKAVGRSVPNLIDDVNRRNAARGLQLSLVEPSGLNPSNVGTARALAKLAWLIKDEPAAQVSVSPKGKLAPRSTNHLLGAPGWEFSLSKTGYINEAGGCLVTLVKVGGEWVAIVLLGSSSTRERWIDLARLRHQLAPSDTFYEPKAMRVKSRGKPVIKRKRR